MSCHETPALPQAGGVISEVIYEVIGKARCSWVQPKALERLQTLSVSTYASHTYNLSLRNALLNQTSTY